VSLRGQKESGQFVKVPRDITANVGFSGVERIDLFREEVNIDSGDCKVILTKDHSLRNPLTELSDLFTDVFHEGRRFPTACDHDDEGCAPSEVHRHRCSAPDGVGSKGCGAVAETIAAES
jgi:hypothetical protein